MTRSLLAVLAVAATAAAAPGAAQAPPVTLAVHSVLDASRAFTRDEFAGRISSGAAGELVTVLGKACPRNIETSIAGATTAQGGSWEAQAGGARTKIVYRARWDGRFSEPVTVWSPIFLNAARAGPRSVVVFVDTSNAFQDLRRKYIQLQRFNRATGKWSLYKRARLKLNTNDGIQPYNFRFTFTQLARGATVRAYVPRTTAAPCYLARASEKITLS